MSLETSAWVASRRNAPKAPTQTSMVAFHASSVLLGASATHQETHLKVSAKHVSQEDMLQVLEELFAMSARARKHPRLVPLCVSSAQAESFPRITYVMAAAKELLRLAVPQAVLSASLESTGPKTVPSANYALLESSAIKPKPTPAKPAKNAQEAPTQARKVCLLKPSVQNARQAKQVAHRTKARKPLDVLNVMLENTPKYRAKQVVKTAQ